MPDKVQLEILKKGTEIWNAWRVDNPGVKIDLSYINLSKLNLAGINLSHVDLRRAKLKSCNLNEADFSYADLYGAELIRSTLIKASFKEADCYGADFSGANLTGANLNAQDLTKSFFKKAIMPQADFSNKSIREAFFTKAMLSKADFSGAKLSDCYFTDAILPGAIFKEADLSASSFAGADLSNANLEKVKSYKAIFSDSNLKGANLSMAKFSYATFSGSNLMGANLRQSTCNSGNFYKAKLSNANLADGNFHQANFANATLYKADLSHAWLSSSNFGRADMRLVNLTNANLGHAILVNTKINNAVFKDCFIYGISIWNLEGKPKIQSNLTITNYGEGIITVDDLQVAQFIYLLLNNKNVRNVIDTLTSKAVLILGRFTKNRKRILDLIREELYKYNYVPLLFDFENTENQSLLETVMTLAGMARFVIADATAATMVREEIRSLVEKYPSKPIQPILLYNEKEFVTLPEMQISYKNILKTFHYKTRTNIITSLESGVIKPAETWLKARKNKMIIKDKSANETRLEKQIELLKKKLKSKAQLS